MCECLVDIKKIGEAALTVEAELKEELVELRTLRVSVSKHAASDKLVLAKINKTIEILER